MTMVFCSSGESRMLDVFLNKTAAENMKMGLYSNSWLPLKSTVLGDLTELTGGGYAKATLPNPTSWTVAASNANGLAEATYDIRTWMFTGSIGNIHGYFVCGTTSDRLIWAEKFGDGPYSVVRSGDFLAVTPRFLVNSI